VSDMNTDTNFQGNDLVADPKGQYQIHKRWHRTGFITISYWGNAKKVIIEIGEVNDGSLVRATKCYIPADQFLAYLKSEMYDVLDKFYPDFTEKGLGFFGGSKNPTPISRIVKISPYKDRNGANDLTARLFKCGHFEGTVEGEGVIKPNYSKKLSENSIKIGLAELAQIYVNLDQRMTAELVVEIMDADER